MRKQLRKIIYLALSSNLVFFALSLFRGYIKFPKRIIISCPPKGQFYVAINDKEGFLLNSASYIESSMYWNGFKSNWENTEVETWSIAARHSDFMIDVGANTGIYSLIFNAVNKDARSISYEPVKRNYLKLKNNLNLNRFIRCTPKNYAVSNKQGEMSILIPQGIEVPYSASLVSNYYLNEVVEKVTVKVESIDSLEIDKQRLLVKIDVEGAEFLVLQGMRNTLARCDSIIFIEITFNTIHEVNEFLSILPSNEYSFCSLNNGIKKIEDLSMLIGTSHINILVFRRGGNAENLFLKRLG